MRNLLPAFALCLPLCAAVLDRVAVSIGNQVITQSQLMEEIKLDSFLNNEPPSFGVPSLRAAADRLIEQLLVRKEMDLGRYPAASSEEAAGMIEKLRQTRSKDPSEFDRQLSQAGISLKQLQDHLLWGLTLSQFIDLRFRPAVQVTSRDVDRYYREQLTPAARPPLNDVRAKIEEILRAQRSDAELDAWLKDTRSRAAILYREEVFGK